MPEYGCQTMTTKLRSVLLRKPDEASCARWRDFGWRSEPSFAGLVRELDSLGELLASRGAEVIFGELVPGDLDSIYTFDPAIVSDGGVIALRPGKELRRPEAEATVADLARLGIPVAALITETATT